MLSAGWHWPAQAFSTLTASISCCQGVSQLDHEQHAQSHYLHSYQIKHVQKQNCQNLCQRAGALSLLYNVHKREQQGILAKPAKQTAQCIVLLLCACSEQKG